ncbi:MAG: hypothetical protein HOP29_04685 [Phycisphaerales bacterium]|nr:hypothetical protein [Phycisphaerales bacterium]
MNKEFDCVRMKHEIQQRLLEEMSRLGAEEHRRLTEERILADPILSRFCRRLPQPTKADEPGPE